MSRERSELAISLYVFARPRNQDDDARIATLTADVIRWGAPGTDAGQGSRRLLEQGFCFLRGERKHSEGTQQRICTRLVILCTASRNPSEHFKTENRRRAKLVQQHPDGFRTA